jgi:ferritin heavy chain
VNGLINQHLNASYSYQAMGKYFDRDDIAFRGFGKFFRHVSHETKEKADHLMNYLSKRGGYQSFKPIPDPKTAWTGPEEALQDSLVMEKYLQSATLDLHWDASEKNDPHLQDYLESEHLDSRVDFVKELSSLLTRVRRLALIPLGLHVLDEELHSKDF